MPLLCVLIKYGSAFETPSVYPMELLAIVAALQLAVNINITTNEIVTDSLGCCQIANRR